MFNPEYYELQADFCSSCNVCTTCALCSACTVCLLDGPVPDAELGAVGCLGLAGRAVNIASWQERRKTCLIHNTQKYRQKLAQLVPYVRHAAHVHRAWHAQLMALSLILRVLAQERQAQLALQLASLLGKTLNLSRFCSTRFEGISCGWNRALPDITDLIEMVDLKNSGLRN